MILVKGFFRSTKNKIYLLIFAIIFIVILMLLNFSKFFNYLLNDLYIENSNVLLIASNDYKKKLEKYKSIEEVSNVVLFERGENSKIISQQGYVLSKDGVLVDSYQNQEGTPLYWDDIIPAGFGNIFATKDEKNEIVGNDLLINMTDGLIYKEDIINSLIGEEISLKYNNQEYIFKISGVTKSISPGITISSSLFEELINKNINYGYIIKESKFEEAVKIEKDLKKGYKDDIIRVSNYECYSEETYKKIESYENTVSLIKVFVIFIIIIFLIIFFVCVSNLISDELKNLKYEILFGFSAFRVCFQLIFEEFLLIINSFILSILFSIIITYFINLHTEFSLNYLYIENIVSVFFMFILCAFFTSVLKLKNDDNYGYE